MKPKYKNLGKVRPTVEGYWDNTKEYSIISIVYDTNSDKSYISKKKVPKGINIGNTEYWQIFGNSIVNYDSIVVLGFNNNGETDTYTLPEAIKAIPNDKKHIGILVSFYEDANDIIKEKHWNLYQFSSNDINQFDNTELWMSVYYNKHSNIIITGSVAVGPNGNWYNDGKDTGIKASGPKGDKGDNGKNAVYAIFSQDNIIHKKSTEIKVYNVNINLINKDIVLADDYSININGFPAGISVAITKSDEYTYKLNVGILPTAKFNERIPISLTITYDNIVNKKYIYITTIQDGEKGIDGISSLIRWNNNSIEQSIDNGKTWSALSDKFSNNLYIIGYKDSVDKLPKNALIGAIYGVGPIYMDDDVEQTKPYYQLYINTISNWNKNYTITKVYQGDTELPQSAEEGEIILIKKSTDNYLVYKYTNNSWNLLANLAEICVQKEDIINRGDNIYALVQAEDENQYELYKRVVSWINFGTYNSVAAGIVQETGNNSNVVMSQAATTESLNKLGSYSNNEEFIRTYVDNNNILLWGIRNDGSIFINESYVNSLKKNINDIYNFLNNNYKENIDYLISKNNKSIKELGEYYDNEEFIYIIKDNTGKIVFSIDKKGYVNINNIPNIIKDEINKIYKLLEDNPKINYINKYETELNEKRNYKCVRNNYKNNDTPKTIYINNQLDFDDIQNKINSELESNDNVYLQFIINKGLYKYKNKHILFENFNHPNASISFIGKNCTIIPDGNYYEPTSVFKYFNVADYSNTYNYENKYFDGEKCIEISNSVNIYNKIYYTDELITHEDDEDKRIFKLHTLDVEDLTEEECKDLYITTYNGYYIFTYKVIKIENNYIYFYFNGISDSDYEKNVAIPTTLNSDMEGYNYGYTRYKIINKNDNNSDLYIYKNKIYFKSEYIYECINNYFVYINNCTIKSLSIEGIRFVCGDNLIYNCDNLETNKFHICNNLFENCSRVIISKSLNRQEDKLFKNVVIEKNKFKNCYVYRNIINIDVYSKNIELIYNDFDNCINAFGQPIVIDIESDNYYIAFNNIKNFGYNAIRVGAWQTTSYTKSNGVVEYNYLYNDINYLKNISINSLLDGGAIYIATQNVFAHIRNNVIINDAVPNGVSCIYLDGGCFNTAVYDNFILGGFKYAIFTNNGADINSAMPEVKQTTNRFIVNNIMTLPYYFTTTYWKTCFNGGNIICYNKYKPKIVTTNVDSDVTTYLPGCDILENTIRVDTDYYDFLDKKFNKFIMNQIIKN